MTDYLYREGKGAPNSKKNFPDVHRLAELKELFREIQTINRNFGNFRDAGRMRKIIETYGPKLRTV